MYAKHTIYLAVAIGCMKVIEEVLELTFGSGTKAFGLIQIDWPFLAGDLVMACFFYYYATIEIQRILRRTENAGL